MRRNIAIFSYSWGPAALWPAALIGGVAALLELGGEPVRLALRYERDAIHAGEIWRLVTGHIVHLGPSHMLMNIAALAVLAFAFSRILGPRDWLATGLGAALAISAGMLLLFPSIDWYVGLSGVLHGFWAAACIAAWPYDRRFATVLSVLLAAKLLFELIFGALPVTGSIASGPVVTDAHWLGAAGGLLVHGSRVAIGLRARSL